LTPLQAGHVVVGGKGGVEGKIDHTHLFGGSTLVLA
jgi:hypothetical protein